MADQDQRGLLVFFLGGCNWTSKERVARPLSTLVLGGGVVQHAVSFYARAFPLRLSRRLYQSQIPRRASALPRPWSGVRALPVNT